jgi:hypothetical protein
MSSFKRKRDDYNDDDLEEDSPSYGRQILPVANLPEDFNDEPMDGLQYLFMVRYVLSLQIVTFYADYL